MKSSQIVWVVSFMTFVAGIVTFFTGRVNTFFIIMVITFILGLTQFFLHERKL